MENEQNLPAEIPMSQDVQVVRTKELVRGQMALAKNFPRDEATAESRILTSCQRRTLAASALYRYPRAGAVVEGPSIRLAETVALRWGNLDYGWRVVEQRDDVAIMEAWCHDLESNTRRAVEWPVKLERQTKKGNYKLSEPRDIYEAQANEGSRRVRACILACIPPEVIAMAIAQCKQTQIEGEKNIPRVDRVKAMVRRFEEIGVNKEMIEVRLGHSAELITDDQLVEMRGIFNSLSDRQSVRSDWFEIPEASKPVSALQAKLEGAANEQ